MKTPLTPVALLLIAMGLLVCSVATAQDQDQWRWQAGFYTWIAEMSGHATMAGNVLPFALDLDDVLDNGTGYNLHVEGMKGSQGFYLDGSYLKYNDSGMVVPEGETTAIEVRGELKEEIVEIGYIHDLWRKQLKPDNPAAALDIKGYIGARYTDMTVSAAVPSMSIVDERSDSWVDPIIGFTASMPVAMKVGIRLRGEYGGFGIGNACDSTYKIRVSALYLFNPKVMAELGWQWMGVDNDELGTTGTTELDITSSGPLLSLTHNF